MFRLVLLWLVFVPFVCLGATFMVFDVGLVVQGPLPARGMQGPLRGTRVVAGLLVLWLGCEGLGLLVLWLGCVVVLKWSFRRSMLLPPKRPVIAVSCLLCMHRRTLLQ